MRNKEWIAMVLAGGRGTRLGVLTEAVAKPAVPFGGQYRIIDFTLSNCKNSGIDTVGILTQYQPLPCMHTLVMVPAGILTAKEEAEYICCRHMPAQRAANGIQNS